MNDQTKSTLASDLIDHLRSAISDGTAGLFDAPALMKQILEDELWRERFIRQTKEIVRFETFDEFVRAVPPEGLGVSRKTLYQLCAHDIRLLDLLDRTFTKRERGGDRRSAHFNRDNVNFETSRTLGGNSAIYALRRLRESHSDLHERVLQNDLTINQAMIEAGLRKKNIVVTANIPKLCAAIRSTLTSAQVTELINRLRNADKIEI